MTEVLNGEAQEVQSEVLHATPKLLIEWSSPWEEFVTSIGPAVRPSPKRLAGEAPVGMFPYKGMTAGWLLEALLLIALVVIPAKLATLRPKLPPATPKYDVIYYSGDELPQTEDTGGARAGRSGKAGGHEAHHRTQTIRVARGESLRAKVVDAPKLNLPKSDSAIANLLAYKPIPGPAPAEGLKPAMRTPSVTETAVAPAPEVQRDKLRSALTLNPSVVAPSPQVQSDKMRTLQASNPTVVPPSPSNPQRDLTSIRVPGSQVVTIVPPAVSAPEQITNLHPKLALPASVVAPPPSEVSHDFKSRGPGFSSGELQTKIVPPPVQVSGATEQRSLSHFGNSATAVVPPPVQMSGASTGNRAMVGSVQTDKVVAPPVQMNGATTGRRAMVGSVQTDKVVAPPVQIGAAAGQGWRSAGTPSAVQVVPPAPSLTADSSAGGLGRGSRGVGLGGPLDAGSVAAPPSPSAGSSSGNGVILSSQPGSKAGVPTHGGPGSLAMSPTGGNTPGVGGVGGGAGLGKGTGPGSGLTEDGPGATKSGTGRGSDTVARAGISPYPGAGGAGTGAVTHPAMPGVSVHGGSNVVTLPSFGGGAGGGPNIEGRTTSPKAHEGPAITIVGTSRSGGALNMYGSLKGDKVYTIYIDTSLGTAVMEYADPSSAAHPYAEDLVAPQPMRAELPANLKASRLIIACVLDRSGMVKNPKVLESSSSELAPRVLTALASWKFRPVFRGEEPVEVNAILGFAINTN